MKKGRRRTTALLLAVCMVFSLISGVPVNVYAEEGDPSNSESSPTGLVVAWDIDWKDDVPTLNPNAAWEKEAGCDLYGAPWGLKYNGKTVTVDEIEVEKAVSPNTVSPNEVEYTQVEDCATQNKRNSELIDFTFPEVGDYVITYNSGNKEDNTITAHVGYPAIGIYTTSVLSENLVKTDEVEYESGKSATYYIIPNKEQDWTKFEYTIQMEWGDTSGITVNDKSFEPEKVYTDTAKVVVSNQAYGDFAIKAVGTITRKGENQTEIVDEWKPECYLAFKEKQTGLVVVWPEWSNDVPYCPENPNGEKSVDMQPLEENVLYFRTIADETINPYDGELTVKKVNEDGSEAGSTDATIAKHPNFTDAYVVTFAKNAEGTYRIYAEDNSYVTVNIKDIDAGFYSSQEISMDNYIDCWEYSDNSNREFYFAFKEQPYDDVTVTLVTENGKPKVTRFEGDDEEVEVSGVDVAPVRTWGEYTVYKVTLTDAFAYEGHIRLQTQWNRKDEQEPEERDYWIELCSKKDGLLCSGVDWDNDKAMPTKPSAFEKNMYFPPMMTHLLYFATVDNGAIHPYDGSLTVKKVNSNGTVVASADATLKKTEEKDKNYYELYFKRNAEGVYRICAADGSYVTVHIEDIDCGFYNSPVISKNSFIENFELTFSESSNRTFYLACKADQFNGLTEGEDRKPVVETNGVASKVTFEQVNDSNGYKVYKITLGENFETSGCDGFDFWVGLDRKDGGKDGTRLFLKLQKTGLVFGWAIWDDEIGDCDFSKAPTEDKYFNKVNSVEDESTVLFFGKMDANGKVTPVRNVTDITVDNGATIEKYEDGALGFYEIILPERNEEYTFTCGNSKVRITRSIPMIQFFKDADCKDEIMDYSFFVEGDKNSFYVKFQGLNPDWEDAYQYIVGKDENQKGDDFDKCYFSKDYSGDKTLRNNESAPVSIEAVNVGNDDGKSAMTYKITVKDNAPTQLSLYIKASINAEWNPGAVIQICKIKAESDETSTFKGDGDQLVSINEAPQPKDLVGDNEEGLTDAQKQAIEDGGDLSVSIKADEVKVGDDGKVEVPEDATDEQKQEIQKVQDAVDKIHEKKDKDFSDKYQSQFLDLTVKTIVKPKDSDEKIEGKVTETKAPLVIKIPLPKELKDKGHYVILRYHDGKSDILTVKVEDGYLIFETDRFSTYAIVYRDKEPIDDLDFSKVTWSNSATDTLTYDGTTKTCPVQLTGLPQGCTATLSGTSASAVGEYTVKIDTITYTSTEGTKTYKLNELADKLPKSVVSGYNWAIEQKASDEKPEGGNGGGTGGGSGSGSSGSKPEESKPEESKPEDTKPEDTKPEDGKDSADTVTNPDGTVTKTEKETVTNGKGKEVVVTTTTKLDANGAVISVVEKSVIAASSSTTSTTVTVKKDAAGTIKSATASIAKTVKSGSKATIYASLIEQIVEAAGTDKVKVSMTVKDSEGKTKYTIKVYAENLKAGEKLYIYKYDTKNGYTMVDDKTYKVSKSGNVAVSISKKATYELVTKENAEQIAKQIKSTIKPKKASASVKKGKSANFTLSSKANQDNIKSVSYTTSKKSVATVNKSGKITAKGKGIVSIKAKVTLKNGETKTIKMTIKVK